MRPEYRQRTKPLRHASGPENSQAPQKKLRVGGDAPALRQAACDLAEHARHATAHVAAAVAAAGLRTAVRLCGLETVRVGEGGCHHHRRRGHHRRVRHSNGRSHRGSWAAPRVSSCTGAKSRAAHTLARMPRGAEEAPPGRAPSGRAPSGASPRCIRLRHRSLVCAAATPPLRAAAPGR